MLFKFFEDMNRNNIKFDELIHPEDFRSRSVENFYDSKYVAADNIYETIRVVCNHPNPHHHHHHHRHQHKYHRNIEKFENPREIDRSRSGPRPHKVFHCDIKLELFNFQFPFFIFHNDES